MEPLGSAYLLDEQVIGRGAMGQVYIGERRDNGQRLAVKVLRPELSDDPEIVSRFLQERSILVGLEHPNLVHVHDLILEAGRAAVVMDLVEGADLRKMLDESGTLPPAEAVTLAAEVLEALAVVHGAGVVHRDVKPENVLVDRTGHAHVTDFGIAKITTGRTLTRLTGFVGTPEYIAPEAAENAEARSPVDVYSTGIMLYEMLAGVTPFAGGHPVAVLRRHLDEMPQRPPAVDDATWTLISAMLAKAPDLRPTASEAAISCRKLALSLANVPAGEKMAIDEHRTVLRSASLTERPTVMKPSRMPATAEAPGVSRLRWRTRPVVFAFSAALLVVVGSVVAVLSGSSPSPAPSAAYGFSPAVYPTGLLVTRTWTLSLAGGTQLRESLSLTNGGRGVLRGWFEDVIPNQVAPSVADLKFSPNPGKVVSADPVVAYSLSGLRPGSHKTVAYVAKLKTSSTALKERLRQLVADQIAAQSAFNATVRSVPRQVTLLRLRVSPPRVKLNVGQVEVITVTGTMSDGTRASAAVLAGVAWTTSARSVATVSGGVVDGVGTGTATITAQAGEASGSVSRRGCQTYGVGRGIHEPGHSYNNLADDYYDSSFQSDHHHAANQAKDQEANDHHHDSPREAEDHQTEDH